MTGSSPPSRVPTLTRRTLLGGAAAGIAALTGGCTLVGGGSKSGSGPTIRIALIPDPTGASAFYRTQFDKFTEQTGITVEVIENPAAQQVNAVQLMFKQGNPPDVYRAQGAALDSFNSQGWAADLTAYADKDKVADRLGAANLDPRTSGLHRDGKLLSLPLVAGNWSSANLLLWSKSGLAEVGATKPPATISELDQVARAISAKGKGKYYGYAFTTALGRPAADVSMLINQAAPSSIWGTSWDLRTGKVAYTDPGLLRSVEFYRKLHADGVVEPGWQTWEPTRAYTEFAKGTTAMFLGSCYQVNEIKKLSPDLDFGVAPAPVPDTGRVGYAGQPYSFSPIWSMSSQSKNPEAAWKLMNFLVSEEFQRAYFETFRSFTAVTSAWKGKSTLSAQESQMVDVLSATIKRIPDPTVVGSAAVRQAMIDFSGNPDFVFASLASQAISRNQPIDALAKDQQQKVEAFWSTEFAKLNDAGKKISAADFTYADWDLLKDWTPAGR
ncbi:ABC transporter substrate-binding protein [Dactylosporangium sp. CA-233914]|uniref:ABC transporter substrate-binding protein n=1 Tax=Dactylosporangium sp. CA-233914 TaxID=3239934 RepID=UPI003D8E3388